MFDEIDPPTAHVRLQDGWHYVDVRTPQEFAQGRPVGAVNIPILFMGPMGVQPNPNFVALIAERYSTDSKLVLGCKSGGRSATACQVLGQAGYATLANMLGGYSGGRAHDGGIIAGWHQAGFAVEQG